MQLTTAGCVESPRIFSTLGIRFGDEVVINRVKLLLGNFETSIVVVRKKCGHFRKPVFTARLGSEILSVIFITYVQNIAVGALRLMRQLKEHIMASWKLAWSFRLFDPCSLPAS